jgi:hypothetical protein
MSISLQACWLILSGVLLSQCTSTQLPSVTAAASVPANPTPSTALGDTTITVYTQQAESFDPNPNKPYHEMGIWPIAAEPTNYSAAILWKRDSLGTLLLEMKLNPSQHSIQKLSLAYVLPNPKQTAKQIGEGTGHYDPTSQRYYFSTFYQVITHLPNKQVFYSDLYPVHGWLSTRTNTIGLQL